MVSVTVLATAILLFTCTIVFCFFMWMAENNRCQFDLDKVSLELARELNVRDRIGKVNHLIARNRELVYTSRGCVDDVDGLHMSAWAPLANYLCDQARSSRSLIESERKGQIEQSKQSVRNFVGRFNASAKTPAIFALPWWQTAPGKITDVQLGTVQNVQSNVKSTDVYPDLRAFDQNEMYFQKGSDLYCGDINAKLPSPDNDLDFKLAPVSAPVEKTTSPARLINADSFRAKCDIMSGSTVVNRPLDMLPSAVRIVRVTNIKAMKGQSQTLQHASYASCTGAGPPPDSISTN